MSNSTEERITITPEEAAQMLGVGRSTIYKLLMTEGFPAKKIGKIWFISVSGLKRWADQLGE